MVKLNITPEDCQNVADFMRLYFFDNIRDDPEMDNMDYVHGLIHAIEELERAAKGVNNTQPPSSANEVIG